jgi:hypothetical protein
VRAGELAPAVVALGGGSALLGALTYHEYRRDSEMKRSRQAYTIVFPAAVDERAVLDALKSVTGIGHAYELVTEVVADEHGVHYLLHLPERVATSVIDQLSAALPGLRADLVEPRTTGPVTAAARVVVGRAALLRTDGAIASSRAILEGLGALRAGERLSLRWALRPSEAPIPSERSAGSGRTSLKQRVEDSAARARLGEPGFVATALILARAERVDRARGLVSHVVSVLRSRRGVGQPLIIRRGSVRSASVMPATGRSRGWLSAAELLPMLAWPLGEQPIQGVEQGAARRIPVPRGVPRTGRHLFIGRDAYGERAVALTPVAATHHLAVVGPSGVGKSSVLSGGIVRDLEAGFGGVVIDPKSDLVSDVLDRVPAEHAHRVVVLDPAQPGPIPGLDLLGVGDPDLRSDVVLGALAAIFKDSWGVRTDTYLRLGLRTLSELPPQDRVLTNWLRLFTDVRFRARAVQYLTDPLLIAAWQSYQGLSPVEQSQHVAAPVGKVLNLLSRPSVRGVLAQQNPRLDIGRLLAERRWLLVALSPGRLGEAVVRLLSSILIYAVWTAVEARAALPKTERHPAFLYLDELQSLASLPFGVEYLFERARGLNCGVTVATQTLGRLPDSLRQSLLGNVGSLITFRQGYDEAIKVARELPGLAAQDIQALRRFEVAARVSTGEGSEVSIMTGRTEPPGEPTGQAERIRELSAERYGQDIQQIDADLHSQPGNDPPSEFGKQRRVS